MNGTKSPTGNKMEEGEKSSKKDERQNVCTKKRPVHDGRKGRSKSTAGRKGKIATRKAELIGRRGGERENTLPKAANLEEKRRKEGGGRPRSLEGKGEAPQRISTKRTGRGNCRNRIQKNRVKQERNQLKPTWPEKRGGYIEGNESTPQPLHA